MTLHCEHLNVASVDWLNAARNNQLKTRPDFMAYEGFAPYMNCSDFEDFAVRFSKVTTLGTFFNRLGDGKKLLVDQVFRLEEADGIWEELSSRFGNNIAPQHENKGSLIDGFEWTGAGKQPTLFKSSEKTQRGFCPKCGSSMCAIDDGYDKISLPMCTLDDSSKIRLGKQHSYQKEAPAWWPLSNAQVAKK